MLFEDVLKKNFSFITDKNNLVSSMRFIGSKENSAFYEYLKYILLIFILLIGGYVIISVIKDRDYIQNEERRLNPVELGFMINDLLVENFPDIMTTEFTAKMEEQLDEVEVLLLES